MVKTNIYHDFMIPYSLPSSQAIRHISVDCEQSLEGRHYLYLLEKKEISQYIMEEVVENMITQNNTETCLNFIFSISLSLSLSLSL